MHRPLPLSKAADSHTASGSLAPRFERLDALRGVAIVWMALFHLAFDLNHFRWLDPRQNFYTDPLWTVQRACIVSLFMFCAGLSLAAALHAGQTWPKFWKRWAQIAGCALLVSIGSAWMFPKSWISFGVLHGIAVMLVLARLAAPLRRGLWPLGCAVPVVAVLGAAPLLRFALDQLGRPGHQQAGDRGLRTGAALVGRDAVRPGRGPVAAARIGRIG